MKICLFFRALCVSCIIREFFMYPNVIDVRDTDFCYFIRPISYNFIIFDYYEYYVDWKTKPAPPLYKYWNISIAPVEFIKSDKKFNKYRRVNKAKIF